MKKKIVVEIICYALVILFIYAAASKLMKFDRYQRDLIRSPLLGVVAIPISIVIPALEILISGFLLFEKTRNKGLLWSFILMILFTIYVIYAIYIAKETPCSCGGIIRDLTWRQHLIFNLLFTALAWIGFRWNRYETTSMDYTRPVKI